MLQIQRRGLVLHCMDTSKPHEHACAQLKGLFWVQLTVLAIYKLLGRLTMFNTELSQKRYWCGLRFQEAGEGVYDILSLPCHHQNGSCIKMGSNERHFNVSLIVRGKVTKTVSTGRHLWKEQSSDLQCWLYIYKQGLFLFSYSVGYLYIYVSISIDIPTRPVFFIQSHLWLYKPTSPVFVQLQCWLYIYTHRGCSCSVLALAT